MSEADQMCGTCRWWGSDTDKARLRPCLWPRPFWMERWYTPGDNDESRYCPTWEQRVDDEAR